MNSPAIRVQDVTHVFDGDGRPVTAVERVTFEIPQGSFVSLLGPSGSGKSTLLRILAGLLKPTEGRATIAGQVADGRPAAAFMPQRDALLPWRRTLDNATLGATIAGIAEPEARDRARAVLPRFGLEGFEAAWPGQLSGGMRQRLALLRTFLMPCSVLLLDEPFGALDAITRRRMYLWLESVWEADRRTVLFVTHDVEEALILSDQVLVMSERPGHIVATVEHGFDRPRDAGLQATAGFAARKAELLSALDGGGGGTRFGWSPGLAKRR